MTTCGNFEEISKLVIGCAIDVHRELGPGLLESTYHRCLEYELDLQGVRYESEAPIPVVYKGKHIDCAYRADIMIPGQLIVELKSVRSIEPIHEAQLITYLKLSRIKAGLIINFNTALLKQGIKRVVN